MSSNLFIAGFSVSPLCKTPTNASSSQKANLTLWLSIKKHKCQLFRSPTVPTTSQLLSSPFSTDLTAYICGWMLMKWGGMPQKNSPKSWEHRERWSLIPERMTPKDPKMLTKHFSRDMTWSSWSQKHPKPSTTGISWPCTTSKTKSMNVLSTKRISWASSQPISTSSTRPWKECGKGS